MDDDEDLYIFCGTALPDPEDGPSAQKRANRELQVRDEEGRQRFHGAFTGGFSAGYFNTVGTKEGWAPSTFVSSRSKGADRVEQHPEDFMDAEDFGEFGIAPRKIHTTAKFRDVGTTSGKRKAPDYSDAVIPGEPPLKELVQPVTENIGNQILIKMGWKPGQGIGPRVKKGNRWRTGGTDNSASTNANSEADDPMLAAFTFAPQDTASLPYTPKDDYHGIGYTGLSTKSVLSAPSVSMSPNVTKSWLEKSKKKLLISGKAFGIGALEDDDDVDIYSHEDMSQYDFSEFTMSNKSTKESEKIVHASHSSFGAVLDGFVGSEKAVTVRKTYRPPQLPTGYIPVRRSVHVSEDPVPTTSKRQVLTADDRSLILGERKFVTMDLPNASSSTSKTVVPLNQKNAEHTSNIKTVASGFQPFINNPEKQKRYEEYLRLTKKESIKALQPASMTEWEKQLEMEEFACAASLYQPLSKMLSSRFVSRTHLETEQGGIVKMEKSSPEKVIPTGLPHQKTEWYPSSLLCKRFNIPNPYPNSNNVGMPDSGKKQKFLFDCLSFEDETKQSSVPDLQEKHKEGKDVVLIEAEQAKKDVVFIKIEQIKSWKDSEDNDLNSRESEITASEEVVPGVSKPPMDLFKAIFENTSDEEEESNHSDQGHNEEETCSVDKSSVISVNNELNSMPTPAIPEYSVAPKKAFGVFANLDLDMLNSNRQPDPLNETASSSVSVDPPNQVDDATTSHNSNSKMADESQPHKVKCSAASESFYGPQLPPDGITPSPIEPKKHSHKHSRRKEKHKHHKHKKKKSKKQKKKRSSRDSARSNSISSASSDCDDIDPSIIIKKLNDLQNKTGKKFGKY